MCGIAGYISLKNPGMQKRLLQAAGTMQHRGPDAEGFYFSDDEKVGFLHRRLSILDLSETANQPMFSHDKRYIIVFNGEVYNYKELQQLLHDKGSQLSTTSDTEVILQLFTEKGPKIFTLMNGMFALAIYDTEKKILTLARDHTGIKPLFIYVDEEEFIFASELKAIKKIQKDKLTINKKAIPYFLHLGYIPHPQTIFNKVEKFPAATYLQVQANSYSLNEIQRNAVCYWHIETQPQQEVIKDENKAKGLLSDLLNDAIQKQLISDVPIGTFLSGGIDSSLITAIASKASSKKINSFSIAIDEGKYNESKYALNVASYLKTDHHEFHVKENEVAELVHQLLPLYDEPFADSSAFPTMMVSKLAKKHVTVALSGDGGDELFMGYGMYKWAKRLSNNYPAFIRKPLFIASQMMNDKYQRAGNLFAYNNIENIKSHIFSQEQYFFSEPELHDILLDNAFDFRRLNSLNKNENSNKEEEQSLWDLKYYLTDDLLVKVDRASMHYSLETRVPLLDYRIVEFSSMLHRDLKLKNNTTKYLLKQVLYDHVPKEIFDRPKQGFSIPLIKWLKTDLNYLLEKYTTSEIIEKYHVLDYRKVCSLKKQYLAGKNYLYNRLWAIIVLHWWLEDFNLNNE